jgi:hypothetical protein
MWVRREEITELVKISDLLYILSAVLCSRMCAELGGCNGITLFLLAIKAKLQTSVLTTVDKSTVFKECLQAKGGQIMCNTTCRVDSKPWMSLYLVSSYFQY